MISTNPFSELSGFISPMAMQIYVVLMVLMVIGGTVLDMIHKKAPSTFLRIRRRLKRTPSVLLAAAKKPRLPSRP